MVKKRTKWEEYQLLVNNYIEFFGKHDNELSDEKQEQWFRVHGITEEEFLLIEDWWDNICALFELPGVIDHHSWNHETQEIVTLIKYESFIQQLSDGYAEFTHTMDNALRELKEQVRLD